MKAFTVTLVMACVLTGCSALASTTKGSGREVSKRDCPVTIPPNPGLKAPEPWPAQPSNEDWVWFGDENLWTVLSPDGDHPLTKGVWWSARFPGGQIEEQPDIQVTWTRIGEGQPRSIESEHPGTNAYTVEDHWFMINGVDPEPGCWEVTASYRGATLSYVFEYAGA